MDNFELHRIGGRGGSPDKKSSLITEYEQIVQRPIHEGETLRSVSLKYRIPVSILLIAIFFVF